MLAKKKVMSPFSIYIYSQQTNLAFTAEEAAAEQAWISSLLPEALTRRT